MFREESKDKQRIWKDVDGKFEKLSLEAVNLQKLIQKSQAQIKDVQKSTKSIF